MLNLSEKEIQHFYSMKDCLVAVKDAFRLFSLGKVTVPLRTQITEDKTKGTYLCMPAACSDYDASCVKVLNVFPNNSERNLPSIHAEVLLIDTKTGKFEALLDGNFITQIRTGAATGVALKYLAKKDSKIGALIGTGGQAKRQLEAMLLLDALSEIRIFSQNPERCLAFINEVTCLAEKFNCQLIAAKSAEAAIDDADIIVTVTNSNQSVYDGNLVKKGATISAIGSYQPHMQETPAELLMRCDKIYFDSKDAVLSEAGDLLAPLEGKQITTDKFTGDIGEVILGKVPQRESDDEIIFFKSVGIAAQDLMTAKSIYQKYINQN